MTDIEITTDELPITLDLPPIKCGSDYQFSIQILDDNDDPVNTTGWDMEIKGRSHSVNGTELFDLTTAVEITHTPASGLFTILIDNTITSALTVSKVYWDCKVTDDGDLVTFPFEGVFDILQAVTR